MPCSCLLSSAPETLHQRFPFELALPAAAESMQNIFEVQSTESMAASSCETTPAVAMVAARGIMVGALWNATRKEEQHQTGEALPIFCVLEHY